MHLESTVLLEENISVVFNNVTDLENSIWRSDLKEVRVIDSKNFMEYSNKIYPTFYTIIKKTKNKVYELEFTNNELEGHISYKFQKEEDHSSIFVALDVHFVDTKFKALAKQKLKRKWKIFLEDLSRVGK